MTPLQAAVKAGYERSLVAPQGKYEDDRFINEDDARAIILAFLDAAAGDERMRMAVVLASACGENPGKAAITALKEAVG